MAVAIEIDEALNSGQNEKNGQVAAAKDRISAAQRAASDLLNRLYDHGILDLVRAMASGGDDTVTRIAAAANAPQSLRAMKNGLALLSILSSLDPNVLERIARNTSQSQAQLVTGREPPGLWAIFKKFTSRDSRRALAAVAAGLEATGRALNTGSNKI